MRSAAFGGKRQQRDARVGADENTGGLRSCDGDLRKLYRSGIDDDGAVGESEDPLVSETRFLHAYDKDARDGANLRRRADAVECGPDGLAGRVGSAADESVSVPRG